MAEEFSEGVLHSASRRLVATADSAHVHGFAGNTGDGVDVVGIQGAVSIRDPPHLARARAHVGSRHVEAGTDVAFLRQLHREIASDQLELSRVVVVWIDLQGPFRSPVRDIDDGALVGHQGGQGLHLVLIGDRRIADAAFHWQAVLAVDGAPASEDPKFAPYVNGEADLEHGVARPDLAGDARLELHRSGGRLEHPVDAALERLALLFQNGPCNIPSLFMSSNPYSSMTTGRSAKSFGS